MLPRLSFAETFGGFEAELTAYSKLYAAWSGYQNAVDSSGADALDVALKSSSSLYKTLTGELNGLDAAMTKLHAELTDAQREAEKEQAGIQQALQHCEAELKSHLSFSCSLPDMLSSAAQLSQLAFFPEDASAGTMAGFAGWSMAMPALSSAVKQREDQDMAIEKLDVYREDLNLSLIPQYIKNWSTVQLPNAYKVINAAQLLETKLKALDSIDDAAVQAMIGTINAFIASVQHLNDLIMQYNSMIGKHIALSNRRDRVLAQMAQYGSDRSDPSKMPDPQQLKYVQYLFSLMEHARDQVLASLYSAMCSYNVWALSNSGLTDFLTVRTIDDVMPETLSSALVDLQEAQQNALGNRGQPPTRFSDLAVIITDPGTIADLKAGQMCTFMLTAPKQGDTTSPFGGGYWADIRITDVAVQVQGLTAASPPIHLILKAYGAQSFYDQDTTLHSFSPASLIETVNVDYYDGGNQPGGSISPSDPTFPLPSPFTTWRLEIGKDNQNVNTSAVTAIKLTFAGQHYDFRSTRRSNR